MKILFEVKSVSKANFLPKLKAGVEVFEIGAGAIFVGNLKRSIQLNNIPISLLRSLTGWRTIKQLAEVTTVEMNLLEEIIELLSKEELIDIYPTKLILEDRHQSRVARSTSEFGIFKSDVEIRDFDKKIATEALVTTWQHGVQDGGKVRLSKRQEIEIQIRGDEESALYLYLSLISSGFSNSNLKIDRDIHMDDLRSGIFTQPDIGRNIKEKLKEIATERKLFKVTSSEEKDRKLIIYFGNPGEKQLQEWMSQDCSHIVVSSIGPNILIGPLVIPGKSPCMNCVSKVDTKLLKNIKEFYVYQRPTIGALNWIIGYLNLSISEYVDTGKSPLIGSAKVFDLLNPNEIREIKYPRHPTCGCNWL